MKKYLLRAGIFVAFFCMIVSSFVIAVPLVPPSEQNNPSQNNGPITVSQDNLLVGVAPVDPHSSEDISEKKNKGRQELEVRTLQRLTLPTVTETNVITGVPIDTEKKSSASAPKKDTPKNSDIPLIADNERKSQEPTTAHCVSAKTDDVWEHTFDCQEGIVKLDNKETPLYVGTKKHYARIETSFELPNPQAQTTLLRLDHTAQYPSQKFSVFYRDPERTNNNWRVLCSNIHAGKDPTTNYCDVSIATRKKQVIDLRVEGYSPEGTALTTINALSLVQPTDEVANPTPVPPLQPTNDPIRIPPRPLPKPDINFGSTNQKPLNSGSTDPPTIIDNSAPSANRVAFSAPVALGPLGDGPRNILNDDSFIPVETQGEIEDTDDEVTVADEGLPITGAVILNTLRENTVGFGLLLLFGVLGLLVYRNRRRLWLY